MTRAGRHAAPSCCTRHLPWLAHHGAWPVGEEWLHQAWATSYLPVVALLERLAAEGRTDLLTLGVTPVLAAQLDDPYLLGQFHTWLGFWQARALGLAGRPRAAPARPRRGRAPGGVRGARGLRVAGGGTVPPRCCAGWPTPATVELLGGPATHPFQPLLTEPVARFALTVGLDDATLRVGRRPEGIWAPECGYRPGLEQLYADAGVRRFLVDGPTLLGARHSPADAWTVGRYRRGRLRPGPRGHLPGLVAAQGLPGRPLVPRLPHLRPPVRLPPGPGHLDPDAAAREGPLRRWTGRRAAAVADAADFVAVVRQRLVDLAGQRDGRPGLVVVAYDTELFGHWWHEGPVFLEQVLRALPEAGVRVTTLRGAVEAGHVAGPAELGPGSWGSGKDWRVWDGEQVADLVDAQRRLEKRLLDVVSATARPGSPRRADLDQLARDALLALSSDWAFMVTKDSAARYARDRFEGHLAAFERLARAVEVGDERVSRQVAREQRAVDGPFGHLDARLLRATDE